MKTITLYSKKAGIQVSTATKKSERNGATQKEGRIAIRAFTLGENSDSVTMMLNPAEGFKISRMAAAVASQSGSRKITHKFTKDGKETTSVLKLEKWERNGKSGFAICVSRDDTSINVPLDVDNLLYVGEFCRSLSTEQAWQQYKSGDGTSTDEYPEEEVQEPVHEEEDVEVPA